MLFAQRSVTFYGSLVFVRTLVFVIAGGHIFGPVHSQPPFMKPVHVLLLQWLIHFPDQVVLTSPRWYLQMYCHTLTATKVMTPIRLD